MLVAKQGRFEMTRAALLSCGCSLSILITSGLSIASQAAPQPAAPPASPTLAVPAPPAVSPALQAALSAYSQSPDQPGFDRVIAVMKEALTQPPLRDIDAASVIKNHPQLADLGAHAYDAGGAKVWAFNKCPFAQTVIIVTGHAAAPAQPGKPPAFPASFHSQLLSLPPSISVSAAKIVTKSAPAPAKLVKGPRGKVVKRAAAAPSVAVPVAGAAKYLVIAGTDRVTGLITLYGLRPAEGGWAAAPDLFASVPPFLLSSVQGRASFSGPDIVLSLTSATKPQPEKPAAAANGKTSGAASSAYKIVLRFVNNKYLLEGKAPDEAPAMVIQQFLQAVKEGRQDVAKAWLSDNHLASIPKYLGLYGKTDQVYKLVAMSNPMGGGSRFRVVTFGKDDLILDVGIIKKYDGKPRSYLAIKSLFVAPPDPLAKKLVGATASFERIGDPAPVSEPAVNKSDQKQ